MKVLDYGAVSLLEDSTETFVYLQLKMPLHVIRKWSSPSRAMTYIGPKCKDSLEFYTPTYKVKNSIVTQMYKDIYERAVDTYNELRDMGVSTDDAKSVLPQGIYVTFIETAPLSSYLQLCKQWIVQPSDYGSASASLGASLDSVDYEVQMYAEAVEMVLLEKFPKAFCSFSPSKPTVQISLYEEVVACLREDKDKEKNQKLDDFFRNCYGC
jgi:thymidylate synthase ThyX